MITLRATLHFRHRGILPTLGSESGPTATGEHLSTVTREHALLKMSWRDQIATIIAETERNLGSRVAPRPAASRPPPANFYMPPAPQHQPQYSVHPDAEFRSASSQDLSRASHQRMMETIKCVRAIVRWQLLFNACACVFIWSACPRDMCACVTRTYMPLANRRFELDVRGSLAQKQLEAVREEMSANTQEAERRWLDVAKQVEQSVSAQLESERQMRAQTETQLHRLQDSATTAQQETLKIVSEFQSTSLDHSELLRRLEQDIAAFKLETETRLAEEGRRVSTLATQQKDVLQAFDPQGSGGVGSGAQHPLNRLAEVEQALLQEREFRKHLEEHVISLRDTNESLPGLISTTVQQTVGDSSGGMDEKVKECGRLIVRMGTELMEETKRRQVEIFRIPPHAAPCRSIPSHTKTSQVETHPVPPHTAPSKWSSSMVVLLDGRLLRARWAS